jgi:peroxiredoxin
MLNKLYHISGFLLFAFFFIPASYATDIIIKGNNPDYSGQTINLYLYKNQITNIEQKIASTKVDSAGNFLWTFSASETQYVFSSLGIFHAFLYTEPGNTYEVKLPPYTPKKQDEKLNPFFEEIDLHLLILSVKNHITNTIPEKTSELNYLIHELDSQFNPIINKYAIRTYTYQELSALDSSINVLKAQYDTIQHPFFQNYYFYRLGLLKFSTSRVKSRVVSYDWFLNKPVYYNNPAYMELFNQVYDKFFGYYGRTRSGKKIYSDINTSQSLFQLKQTLSQDDILKNDTLKELVILKGIHDSFYEMNFSRNGLLLILDSLLLSTKLQIHREIGQDIRTKITKLLVGHSPPDFQLPDISNTLKTLKDYRGSYVYLNFCTTQNYACIKDLDQLSRIHEKYGQYVTIITISLDETLKEMQDFVRKKGFKWTFLHYGNQPEIIRDYDIRTFPTYFLIDRDGKLVWSPGPSPTENFDVRFFNELRAKGIL